ncbi:hypothetical protein TNCV_367701 [Trichonephila clavipes]|nr:hypothetical protein TNCV_367701 [Trichonephila clavipes]
MVPDHIQLVQTAMKQSFLQNISSTLRQYLKLYKAWETGWGIPLLKNSPNSHSKPSSMNDLEAMKTRQIVAEIVKLGISSLYVWFKCTNRDFWWMLLALGPQMMAMMLVNSFGGPVIASSLTESDEIMIRKRFIWS